MEHSIYRKFLESLEGMDKGKIDKLVEIYLKSPSLPELQASRTLLAKLKVALLRHRGICTRASLKTIRHSLDKNGT